MDEKSYNLDTFFQTTRKDLEKKIATIIADKNVISLLQGGKRFRPLLSQLTFKVCSQENEKPSQYQKSLEIAISIELIHTASLVHDYVIDKGKKRRRPSFQFDGSIDSAILMVHKILAIGFNLALSHGEEFAKLYADTWEEILTGELKKVEVKKKTTKQSFSKMYNDIIDQRLTSLFSSACKLGAMEADMSAEISNIFAEYGRETGLAYQLTMDLIDLEKGEIKGKRVKAVLNRLKNKSKSSLKEEDFKKLFLDEINKHVKHAETLGKSQIIPSSPHKNLLTTAPTYIINERLKAINVHI